MFENNKISHGYIKKVYLFVEEILENLYLGTKRKSLLSELSQEGGGLWRGNRNCVFLLALKLVIKTILIVITEFNN